MREGWRTVELGSLCAFIGGGAFPRIHQGRRAGTYPFVKVSDLSLPGNERFLLHANNWVGEETLALLKTKLVPSRATVFAKIGEGLKSEKLRLTSRLTAIDNNLMAAIPRAENVDYQYLFYLLSSVGLSDWAQGSALPFLRQGDLAQIPVTIPPLAVQRRIAGVLGALDDLIDTNKRLAVALDECFQALWRLSASDSVEISTVGDHALVTKGLSYKGAFLADAGLPMVNLGSFGLDGSYKESGLKFYDSAEVRDKHRLVRGDLVVANTDLTQVRDILGRPVIVPHPHATSTHHTFQVRVPEGEAVRHWMFAALREESVRLRLISYATGTTVAALPIDALLSQELPWRTTPVIESWWSGASSLLLARSGLLEESEVAKRTRDELLPLLLSGAVTVSEVAA